MVVSCYTVIPGRQNQCLRMVQGLVSRVTGEATLISPMTGSTNISVVDCSSKAGIRTVLSFLAYT